MYSTIRSKAYLLLAGIGLLGVSLVGCKDNDDSYSPPTLQLSEVIADNTFTFTEEGATRQITFTTNRRWEANYPSWVDVTPSRGEAGTHSITLKVLPNNGAERRGQVALNYGSASQTWQLAQAAGSSTDTPATLEGMPLSEFIAKYYQDSENGVKISDEVSFQAVAISDKEDGNTNARHLYVQAGDAGITLRFTAKHEFALGSVVTVKAKDAVLKRFNGGELQLEIVENSEVIATGEQRLVEPKLVSMQEVLDGKHEGLLVALEGVQFVKPEGEYLPGGKSRFHAITDCVSKPTDPSVVGLSMSASQYSKSFKGQTMSDKRGRIVGIIVHGANKAKGEKYRNIYPRSIADLSLTEERCNAGANPPAGGEDNGTTTPPNNGGGTTPNPPAGGGDNGTTTPPSNGGGTTPNPPSGGTDTPTTSANHPLITAYVEGLGFDKLIQIYNSGTEPIDLSAYTLKMENYSSKGLVGIKDLKLSGVLAPGEVKVFKNSQAKAVGFTGNAEVANDICNFNGDDNVALYKGEVIVDVVGSWGQRWLSDSDSNKERAKDIILKRKGDIKAGKSVFDQLEWIEEKVDKNTKYSFLNNRP